MKIYYLSGIQFSDSIFLRTHYISEEPEIRNCPSSFEDWAHTSKYCYKIFTKKLNWTEAESSCGKYGGNLISISSAQLSDVVKNKMNNKELGHLWIGLDKIGIRKFLF